MPEPVTATTSLPVRQTCRNLPNANYDPNTDTCTAVSDQGTAINIQMDGDVVEISATGSDSPAAPPEPPAETADVTVPITRILLLNPTNPAGAPKEITTVRYDYDAIYDQVRPGIGNQASVYLLSVGLVNSLDDPDLDVDRLQAKVGKLATLLADPATDLTAISDSTWNDIAYILNDPNVELPYLPENVWDYLDN
jgi:hypothetical protein